MDQYQAFGMPRNRLHKDISTANLPVLTEREILRNLPIVVDADRPEAAPGAIGGLSSEGRKIWSGLYRPPRHRARTSEHAAYRCLEDATPEDSVYLCSDLNVGLLIKSLQGG